jgi:RNA polymerase sigma-70 factor (ECF subfamily)
MHNLERRERMKQYPDIIKGVRKNDAKSQMAFYDLFARQVYQSAFAIVGSSDEAEEIMQDTMMKVFLKTDMIRDDRVVMMRTLRRMAVNRAIDEVRKRKDFILLMESEPAMSYDVADEEETACDEVDADDIKECISRLSPTYRSVISLRLFEEISFAEIAAQLQVNASTVRVQYTRGIAQLRHLLKERKESYERST